MWVIWPKVTNYVCLNGPSSHQHVGVFFTIYSHFQLVVTCNMYAIQLNPQFKSLECMMEYINRNKARVTIEEYDEQVSLLLILMKLFKHLNLQCVTTPTYATSNIDDSLWGVKTSIKKANIFLVKIEMSLYRWIIINENDLKSPLQYCGNDHKYQFPNVAFLAQQFLDIPRSQIETNFF